MSERDWADGEPWDSETETEICSGCGASIKYRVAGGPPSGYENFDLACDCGVTQTVRAFGPPRIISIQ